MTPPVPSASSEREKKFRGARGGLCAALKKFMEARGVLCAALPTSWMTSVI